MRNVNKTAEEFVASQQADPEYAARLEAKRLLWEETVAKRLEALRPFQDEVRLLGVEVLTPEDLRRVSPLRQELVDILLKWLAKPGLDEGAYLSILLGLHKPKKSFSGQPLIDFWSSIVTDDPRNNLRWNTAYAIAEAQPTGITDWVIERLKDPKSGTAREWLAIAVSKLADPEVASATFREIFDELPVDAAKGLAVCGTTFDIVFLESRLPSLKGAAKKESEKAIKKIVKRLEK